MSLYSMKRKKQAGIPTSPSYNPVAPASPSWTNGGRQAKPYQIKSTSTSYKNIGSKGPGESFMERGNKSGLPPSRILNPTGGGFATPAGSAPVSSPASAAPPGPYNPALHEGEALRINTQRHRDWFKTTSSAALVKSSAPSPSGATTPPLGDGESANVSVTMDVGLGSIRAQLIAADARIAEIEATLAAMSESQSTVSFWTSNDEVCRR